MKGDEQVAEEEDDEEYPKEEKDNHDDEQLDSALSSKSATRQLFAKDL